MIATPSELDLLAAFVAVADARSFGRAANDLGVAKATVSRAVKRLETRLTVELVHRTTHSVSLTTAGVALYERTAPHVRALVRAASDLPERSEEPAGTLRITAATDFATMVLAPMIAEFSLRHPAVTFDLHVTSTTVDLVAGGFDLAFRASSRPLGGGGLTARRVPAGEVRYYASPTYLARRGEPREALDPRHAWVLFRPVLSMIAVPKSLQPHAVVDDFFVARELLRGHVGIGLLPSYIGQACVATGELVRVLPSEAMTTKSGGFYLVYPKQAHLPVKVRAFRDAFFDYLRRNPIA